MKTKIKSKGFTMIELMIALLIAGIMMSYAIPAYHEFGLRQKITNEANSLLGDFTYARVTAIKEGQRIVVRSNAGKNWSKGWKIFIDKNANGVFNSAAGDILLRVTQSIGGNLVFTADRAFISFTNLGAADSIFNITISNADTTKNVALNVSVSGMISSRG